MSKEETNGIPPMPKTNSKVASIVEHKGRKAYATTLEAYGAETIFDLPCPDLAEQVAKDILADLMHSLCKNPDPTLGQRLEELCMRLNRERENDPA